MKQKNTNLLFLNFPIISFFSTLWACPFIVSSFLLTISGRAIRYKSSLRRSSLLWAFRYYPSRNLVSKTIIFVNFIIIICITTSCKKEEKSTIINTIFQKDIINLSTQTNNLEQLVATNSNIQNIQKQFIATRQSYKKVETLSEYYFPEISKAINGPAISEFEENHNKVIPPQGLQVIETYLYPSYNTASQQQLLQEIKILQGNITRLNKLAQNNTLTNPQIFEAIRLELFRITSLGITGFDSPVAQNSIPECSYALQSLENYYKVYSSTNQNNTLKTLQLFKKGQATLKLAISFNQFDRENFIINILNPLGKLINQTRKELGINQTSEKKSIIQAATQLLGANVFNMEAFLPYPEYQSIPSKVVLGKKLFYDTILSTDNSRSCTSCHIPEKAFTDGLEKSISHNNVEHVKRNAPTLLNIGYQRAYFYDSRVTYLEDQIISVINNLNEMHGNIPKALQALSHKKEYIQLFKKAFPNQGINQNTLKNAIASYIRSLSQYNSKFDRHFTGKEKTMNTQEINGFNLFTGKAKCATCHFIPLTNGTVPPFFQKSESEVLGVPNTQNMLDTDLGKYEITHADIHKYAFKTPTIRNIALTAPYMHNGVFKTLEQVIDFYNQGGGLGKGLTIPNQTLPQDKLNLSNTEKEALIAFLKTLTDDHIKY